MRKDSMIKALVATIVITATIIPAYAEVEKSSTWEYWQTLTDLEPYLEKTFGEIKEEIGEGEELTYHGILSMISPDEAVQVYCDYDATISGNEQDVQQITLTDKAEDKYRLGDMAIGENKSDSAYWLYEDGYAEVKSEETDDDNDEGSYYCIYVNPDKPTVFIITYDQFSYVDQIVAREIRKEDLDLYNQVTATR